MEIIFNNSDNQKEKLYELCINSYRELISNQDNSYLQIELEVSIETIKFFKHSIKQVFLYGFETEWQIEITLSLFLDDPNIELGYYTYVADASLNFIDEFLVFH